ncbi:hypothetical protein ACWCQ1_36090 [Streptomyces sp. NPDC002144]
MVTGADIVRVSPPLALEPWHLTQTAPAAADAGGRARTPRELYDFVLGSTWTD